MTYCAALPNWLHLVPLWENVIGLLLMREFWGAHLKEGAPGGKVTHWLVFFHPAAANWDIQAGRAKRRATTTLILLRSLFQCRPPLLYQEWDCKVWSDDKSDIQIHKALSWFRNASLHCTDSIFNLGFTILFANISLCLSLIIYHEGCVYICPLQVTSRKRYLHLNEIKSYMSSVGAKYADIMA